MHHIYTTKAIVIKSLPAGEANKVYFLLTKDLGFIKASAQSVRLDRSKLKGHLEDLSEVSISLVKGKEWWRVTSVETLRRNDFVKDAEKLPVARNIFSLLLRLLHGEEKNEALFDRVDSFHQFLSEQTLAGEQLKDLEVLTVLRVLHELGYLKGSSDVSPFISDHAISADMLSAIEKKKKMAVREINEALEHTNL